MTVNEAELRIDIPRPQTRDRVRFILLGAENPDSLKGIYLDGVTLDEYASMGPQVWGEVIRPTLSDRLGWATFIGTPKGMNHFYDIWQHACKAQAQGQSNWFAYMLKASESGILPQSELDDARATMSEEEYDQEYECSFTAALVGAYYAKYLTDLEKKGQITSVPYDKNVRVDTYWDLGIGDTTAIWFVQQVGKSYHVIDYVEDSGRDLEYYSKVLRERGYYYGDLVWPHDGKARSLETGNTREEKMRSLGWRPILLPKMGVDERINAVRMLLNKCWFDKVKCARGLDALKNYQQKWDSKNQIFSTTPLHNWASNGADAFGYFALGVRDNSRNRNVQLPRQADINYDILKY